MSVAPAMRRLLLPLALLVFLWSWPSLFFLPVTLGRDSMTLSLASAAITACIGAAVVGFAMLLVKKGDGARRTIHVILGLAILIFSALIPLYLLSVEAGIFGGIGGTRGEAIDIAIDRLLAGVYPYSVATSDGSPLTPLPGNLLLASPASVGLGSADFTSAYLLPIGLFLVYAVNKTAAAIAALSLAAAPALWGDYLSGGDLVATSFLAFAVGLHVLKTSQNDTGVARWVWPLILGIVGATRVTTLVVALLVAALVANSGRIRVALIQFGESVLVFLALSLPFYLWNPEEFSPLHVSRFAKNDAGIISVAVAVGLLCLWLARSRWLKKLAISAQLALGCSVFAFLMTALPMLASLETRADSGELLSGYAVLALVAPVIVLFLGQSQPSRNSSSHDASVGNR